MGQKYFFSGAFKLVITIYIYQKVLIKATYSYLTIDMGILEGKKKSYYIIKDTSSAHKRMCKKPEETKADLEHKE